MSVSQKSSFLTLLWNFRLQRFWESDSKRNLSVPANRIKSVFSLRNVLWQNSESLLLFLFHGTEFPVVFSSVEWFEQNFESLLLVFCSTAQNSEHFSLPENCSERNFESFLFRGTAGMPPEQTKCSVYSVFHGIIFLSEIANLSVSFQPITRHSKE